MIEEKRLVAEQVGFRRGRVCRDQVITLMLLGQMKARFRKGMFATFGRHMTGWTGTNYGSVCRTVGLVVEFSPFCRRPTDP